MFRKWNFAGTQTEQNEKNADEKTWQETDLDAERVPEKTGLQLYYAKLFLKPQMHVLFYSHIHGYVLPCKLNGKTQEKNQ